MFPVPNFPTGYFRISSGKCNFRCFVLGGLVGSTSLPGPVWREALTVATASVRGRREAVKAYCCWYDFVAAHSLKVRNVQNEKRIAGGKCLQEVMEFSTGPQLLPSPPCCNYVGLETFSKLRGMVRRLLAWLWQIHKTAKTAIIWN